MNTIALMLIDSLVSASWHQANLAGGNDQVGVSAVSSEATLAFREKSLSYLAVETVEEDVNEDSPTDELPVAFPHHHKCQNFKEKEVIVVAVAQSMETQHSPPNSMVFPDASPGVTEDSRFDRFRYSRQEGVGSSQNSPSSLPELVTGCADVDGEFGSPKR
nr:unnamed protein product [Spirometra erinaceieuropaei]